jgi:hypothetical protein
MVVFPILKAGRSAPRDSRPLRRRSPRKWGEKRERELFANCKPRVHIADTGQLEAGTNSEPLAKGRTGHAHESMEGHGCQHSHHADIPGEEDIPYLEIRP